MNNVFKALLNVIAPGSGTAVGLVEQVIRGVTKKDDIDEAMEVLKANPELLAEVEVQLSVERVALEKEATAQQANVNKQMAVEAISDKWWVSGWRPFNGYLFGISVFFSYPIPAMLGNEIPNIPAGLWVMWAAVLGVAVHSRGKEKLTKLGDGGGGLIENLVAGLIKKK